MENGVVLVRADRLVPNYASPEMPGKMSSGHGTAVLINMKNFAKKNNLFNKLAQHNLPEKVLLTNAHVVSFARAISVINTESSNISPIPCKILFISHDCDLAVIVPDSTDHDYTTIFDKWKCYNLSDNMPSPHHKVSVIGYPSANQRATTQGIISRYITLSYAHSYIQLLNMEITAPINPGNSGGPVVFKEEGTERIGGIVHASNPKNQNQGYAIPLPYLQRFFKDILLNNRCTPMPFLPFLVKNIGNPALRKRYEIDQTSDKGILVTKIHLKTNLLQVGDILMKISGYWVNSEAKIHLPSIKTDIDFNHLCSQLLLGDNIELVLLRDGKEIQVAFELTGGRDSYNLIPSSPAPVCYIAFNGVIFREGSYRELSAYNTPQGNTFPQSVRAYFDSSSFVSHDEHRVIIADFSKSGNKGISYNSAHVIIKQTNGRKICSIYDILHVIEQIKRNKERTLEITSTTMESTRYPDYVLPILTKKEQHALLDAYQIKLQTNIISSKSTWVEWAQTLQKKSRQRKLRQNFEKLQQEKTNSTTPLGAVRLMINYYLILQSAPGQAITLIIIDIQRQTKSSTLYKEDQSTAKNTQLAFSFANQNSFFRFCKNTDLRRKIDAFFLNENKDHLSSAIEYTG